MERSRSPAQDVEKFPYYKEVKLLLDEKLELEQELAESVARTLNGFEEEYNRLIKAANENSK